MKIQIHSKGLVGQPKTLSLFRGTSGFQFSFLIDGFLFCCVFFLIKVTAIRLYRFPCMLILRK